MKLKIVFICDIILFFAFCTRLCYSIDPEYHLLNRLNQIPNAFVNSIINILGLKYHPIEKDVTFWCAKTNQAELVQVFVNDTELPTKLNTAIPITFLIHGWLDSYQRTWVKMLVEEHFRHFDANICVVDWQDWALSEYSISAGKTEMVGNFLGDFIDRMITEKYFAIHDIRLIGHSMGAHIAGFAGQKMKGEIPLIVGLDPAGPMFTKFPLQPIDKRLDTSDAKFVQVIHTDRFIIGSDMNLGHADFYANGGATPQPDCVFPIFQHSRTYLKFSCSHFKAVDYFIASLDPGTSFKATKCHSYDSYLKGKCNGNPTAIFGMHGKTPSGMGGTFYFQTEQYKTDLIDFKVKYKNKDLDYDDYYLWHFIYTFSDPGTQIRLNV